MGRRTERTNAKQSRIANEALQNLLTDDMGSRNADVKHRRANTESKYTRRVKPKNENQAIFAEAIENATIIFGVGPAGTGKTYIAVRKALEMLARNEISKIILTRPAIEAEGEKLGHLPGDMGEKMAPYMRPFYDIMYEAVGANALENMMRNGTVEICPLAFMRGRTLGNCVIILDEAQNATLGQIKMALTRLGENSKAIVTGDPDQSDLDQKLSGLKEAARALNGAEDIDIVHFNAQDIVRSKIVATVLERLP